MRALLISPFLPRARASHGGGVYLHALVTAIAQQVELGLVAFATADELADPDLELPPVARRFLVVRKERAGGLRHRLRMLRAWTLGGLPITVAKFRSSAMQAAIRHARSRFRPAAALLEMGLLAQYLPDLAGIPTVLTDHEAGDPVPAALGPRGFGATRDRRVWERYVDRAYAGADLVQALHASDAARLGARLGRPVGVRPPLVVIPDAVVRPGAAPPRMLFLGDYSHHPNPEAAHFLVREVLPRVRATLPAAELWLAGARAPAAIEALGALAGVRFLGFVPDLPGLLADVRTLVAPVFSGGGSRIKVLTALAHGLPVVANELALRGIDAPPVAARRAESAVELAAAALALLQDAEAAAGAGRAARAWAESAIAPDATARAQVAALQALIDAQL